MTALKSKTTPTGSLEMHLLEHVGKDGAKFHIALLSIAGEFKVTLLDQDFIREALNEYTDDVLHVAISLDGVKEVDFVNFAKEAKHVNDQHNIDEVIAHPKIGDFFIIYDTKNPIVAVAMRLLEALAFTRDVKATLVKSIDEAWEKIELNEKWRKDN